MKHSPGAGYVRNRILESAERNAIAYGMYVKIPAAEIVEIAGSSGLDFVRIDHLHGGFGVPEMGALIRAAYSAGVTPTVRIDKDQALIAAALEFGAMGLTFPDVSSAEEAVRLAALCRRAPRGRRSGPRPLRLLGESSESYARWADAELVVSVQIESRAGLANLDAILAVDGIDMVHCGRADLAAAMGLSGGTNDPAAVRAETAVNHATLAAGKLVGYHVPPGSQSEKNRDWLVNGAHCVTIGGDTQILFNSVSKRASTLSCPTEEG